MFSIVMQGDLLTIRFPVRECFLCSLYGSMGYRILELGDRIFLAQILLETDRWNTTKEYGGGKYNPGQPATEYYAAFYDRGCLQLTWAGACDDYGSFKAFPENGAGIYVDPRINRTSIH